MVVWSKNSNDENDGRGVQKLKIQLTATNGGFHHAFGTFTILFTGCAQCKGKTVEMYGEFEFKDKYNWHDGKVANVAGIIIEDRWANLVEKYENASKFEEKGKWGGTITVDCSKKKMEAK